MLFDFESKDFEGIEFTGRNGETYKGYFSDYRTVMNTIPDGWHAYEIRFNDLGDRFISVEPKCFVNFAGTFLTKERIKNWYGGNEDRYVDIEDWNFTGEEFEE